MVTYTLAEIRNGTEFPQNTKFVAFKAPKYPIGLSFKYRTGQADHQAMIIGYHIEHDTDSDLTCVTYNIEYLFSGHVLAKEVNEAIIDEDLERKRGRYDFDAALRNLAGAEQVLRNAIGGLPDYPANGCCTTPDLQVVTECLGRYCRAERRNDGIGLVVYTNGWDDVGDMVRPTYLCCLDCAGVFAVPEDVVWS